MRIDVGTTTSLCFVCVCVHVHLRYTRAKWKLLWLLAIFPKLVRLRSCCLDTYFVYFLERIPDIRNYRLCSNRDLAYCSIFAIIYTPMFITHRWSYLMNQNFIISTNFLTMIVYASLLWCDRSFATQAKCSGACADVYRNFWTFLLIFFPSSFRENTFVVIEPFQNLTNTSVVMFVFLWVCGLDLTVMRKA